VLANNTGGYSGPPVHPIAVKLVHDVHRLVAREAGVPIVAIGGVTRWEDAAEFILAGATAVQMGSALFADPGLVYRVTRGLAAWVREQNAADVQALVGAVQRW
jgi:dihydroorotate dehydrogenase (NAD+) catalytic subunit